jgi:hypothetical protein
MPEPVELARLELPESSEILRLIVRFPDLALDLLAEP